MSPPDQPYVHGTSPREQARLGLMNDILNTGAIRALEVTHGERVLDLGTGLGQLTRAMARATGPKGKVVGIERSPEQLREAERLAREAGEQGLVDFRQGDATAPPLRDDEWGTFDLAHTRFLLEHLPRPLDLVRVMVRAVAPGGRIVLEDEDHEILRLWPEPPGLMEVWRAYIRSYEARGTDPSVGRKLVALLREAGATPCRCDWVFFGGCAGEVRFEPLVENLARILEGAEESIAATGLVRAAQVRAAVSALRTWGARPDAAFWYAVACVEGFRPGS
jgi:ubiquinone/menaquinone biosynthesis C-methylase UbiE